jgi:hypothetical protein
LKISHFGLERLNLLALGLNLGPSILEVTLKPPDMEPAPLPKPERPLHQHQCGQQRLTERGHSKAREPELELHGSRLERG